MIHDLRFTAVLACSLVAGFASAQTAAPMPAAPPPASVSTIQAVPVAPPPPLPHLPEPAPQPTVPDLTRYLNNPALLNFCTAQVAEFNDRDADIIFIGDSITQGWLGKGKDVWTANFASRNALDFGISGDQTQHVLWRMDNYPIQRLHPKVAVVLIGTNNLHNTAPEIASGVKAVLTKTQTMFPGIKIILVSIMPNRRANDLMMDANLILRTFADDKTVYYLDLVPLMTPVGDNWKGLGPDHLHPDASGYQLWTDAMLPLLNKLLPLPAAQ
jgi:lysophospholipase L1-like esterase